MTKRHALVAAATALGILAGCGKEKCNEETPPVKTSSLATSCPDMAANSTVTVQLPVCPTCNQGTPTCTYRADNIAQKYIQLEPLAEACESSSSCPLVDPVSCPATLLSCQFTSPNDPGQTYTLTIVTADGSTITRDFPISASGGATSCTL